MSLQHVGGGAATKEVFWAEGRAGAKAYRRRMALCLGGTDSQFWLEGSV